MTVTVCSNVADDSGSGSALLSALGCKEPAPPLVLFVSLLEYIQEFFFLQKKFKKFILDIHDIERRYTMTTSLVKQYNFKINELAMEQARAIIKEKGMTMTDAITLFIEQIVLEQDLPIKTAEDLHREQLIEELQAQSERALREYEAGKGTSLDSMRARYGL